MSDEICLFLRKYQNPDAVMQGFYESRIQIAQIDERLKQSEKRVRKSEAANRFISLELAALMLEIERLEFWLSQSNRASQQDNGKL